MSDRVTAQLRLWLEETVSDAESVLGVEDPEEVDEDSVDINVDRREEEDVVDNPRLVEINETVNDNDMDHDGVTQAEPVIDNREFFIGKDKETRWYLQPQMARTSRTPADNIIPRLHMRGPKGQAKNAQTHIQSFECIFNDEIINKIVIYTNIYIHKIQGKYARERDAKLTDSCEIRSLLGILYLAGVLKSGRRSIIEMFDMNNGTGVEAIYVTMTEHRFRFLMRCLRFDDVQSRDLRKSHDKLAAIREVFDLFVGNSKSSYNPSDYLTIDEQLVAFRGNCPFRQYIPSKASKYGIKVFALVSCSDFYTTNLEVYVGTQPDGPFKVSTKPHDLVMRLTEPVSGSKRNITADNWFVSLPLALDLLENRKLTLLGTMRGNKREVPANFLSDKDREPFSSEFGYQDKATIVSYVPKKNKAVIALSTMHRTGEIDPDNNEEKKPVIIHDYNETKYGVDILDKMCHQYDTKRNSKRWPLTLFFHLLNVGAVNSANIFRSNYKGQEKVLRRTYLTELAMELMKPAVQRRLNHEWIPRQLKTRCKIFLGIEEQNPPRPQPPQANATGSRCFICPRSADKKTNRLCFTCQNRVCVSHMKVVCERCYE